MLKKLLELIPSQIKNIFSIVPEVNLKREKGKELIVIKVKLSQSPISYKGKFFKRMGSTTQELSSSELQSFLLEKSGGTWESVIENEATLDDIDLNAIEKFKQLSAKRFPTASNEKSATGLLEKLHLIQKKKFTRAAVLLFGKDPQKFHSQSYIKIGRFKDDATILSMDEVYGNLFQQAEEAIEILKKKYLHRDIKIESLHREEELEIPEVALREAIVNAVVHRDYSNAVTQIMVYADHIAIWNNGELPNKLTFEKLKKKHPSFPPNKLIADVFYKAAYIEQWGHGTVKIIDECKKAGLPDPIFAQDSGGIKITFLKDIFNEDYLKKLMLNDRQMKAILYIQQYGKITNTEYQKISATSKRTASTDLQVLAEKGLLIKIGATGKGTQYILQRGNKGAKGAIDTSKDKLDKKILLLSKQLSIINPDQEVKWHFSTDVFLKILDSWLNDLLEKVIIKAQKFNSFFNAPTHYISVHGGMGQIQFTKENPKDIVTKLKTEFEKSNGLHSSGTTLTAYFSYTTFRKGGLKTFGCNYSVEIKFDMIQYSISMDEFLPDEKVRSKVVQIEHRLLHKALTKAETNTIAEKFGDTIYQHIEYYIDKNELLKGR